MSFFLSNKISQQFLILLLVFLSITLSSAQTESPVSFYGNLRVSGNKIIDKRGMPVQLQGMSLYWNVWSEKYYKYSVVKQLKENWCTNVVRAAIGVDYGDLNRSKEQLHTVVDAAIDLGMYVIIDYHSHEAHKNLPKAISFFEAMAQKYGHHPNVIYEIYNEPLAVSWSKDLKPYCDTVIKTIRKYDADNLIICGTPNWSQYVDEAADNPVTSSQNIAYSLHFYAGTHGSELQQRTKYALSRGLALFVTEFGTVNASGDGVPNLTSTDQWFSFLDEYKISYCNWALNDFPESASALIPDTHPDSSWTGRLTTSGGYMVRRFTNRCPSYIVVKDCNNDEFGSATIDNCGTCSGGNTGIIPNSTCKLDCNNDKDGTAAIDSCGVCSGGNTGIPRDEYCDRDCNGIRGGKAYYDECSQCVGGNTGLVSDCKQDCFGTWGGSAFIDKCGVCIGGESYLIGCSPYFGLPFDIPGSIRLLDYDRGGEGIAFHEMDTVALGFDYRYEGVDIINYGAIGLTRDGEWLQYSVNVQESGWYKLVFEVRSDVGGSWHLEFNKVPVLFTDYYENRSEMSPLYGQVESGPVFLAAGDFDLRFVIDKGGFEILNMNFNQVSITGVKNISESDLISIYPNPSDDYIRISGKSVRQWKIFNVYGEIVKSGTEALVKIADLPAGTYTVSIDGVFRKFVKN